MLNNSNHPPPPPLQPSRACAACKHQRKKCLDTCLFRPYFTTGLAREFDRAQKVFGISNITKMAAMIPPGQQRKLFFDSIVQEAELRFQHPVTGAAGMLCSLQRQNSDLKLQLEVLRKRLRMYEGLVRNGNGNGVANGNDNGFAICNCSDINGNGVHGLGLGTSNGSGNGLGFALNGTVVYYGHGNGEAALPNGELKRRNDSPFPV